MRSSHAIDGTVIREIVDMILGKWSELVEESSTAPLSASD